MNQPTTNSGFGAGGGDDGRSSRDANKHEFGRRLHSLLLRRGMRQADLARAAGVKRDAISSYVNGKALPEALNLHKIAEALGVEANELLPETLRTAIDNAPPALSIRASAGQPGTAWLMVNRAVSTATAVKIAELLEADDAPAADGK